MHLLRFSIALLLLAGCSGGHGTAVVSGTVLYKSQPVEGATVNFLPKGEGPNAKPAHGKTDSSGRFTLTTYFGPTEQPGAYDPHKDPPLKNHLPLKYSTPQQTPLTATIKPGANRPEFKLDD